MAIQSYNNVYLPYVAENLGIMFEHATDNKINPIIFGIHSLIQMLLSKLKKEILNILLALR